MWLFYSSLSAVAVGISDIARKVLLNEMPLLPTIALIECLTVVILLPFFIHAVRKIKKTDKRLIPNKMAWQGFIAATSLDVIGFWMFSAALKWGPISVVSPLRNTVPLFSLLLGYRVLRERTGVWEKGGIVLAVVGLVLLINSTTNTDYYEFMLAPHVLTALILALGVAMLSAIILIANKYAIGETYGGMNVIVLVTLNHIVAAMAYTIATFASGDMFPRELYAFPFFSIALGIGMLSALASWAVLTALSRGDTVRVSPILRLSVLVSVIVGGAWFMETNLMLRTISTIIFLVGLTPMIIWQEKTKTDNRQV